MGESETPHESQQQLAFLQVSQKDPTISPSKDCNHATWSSAKLWLVTNRSHQTFRGHSYHLAEMLLTVKFPNYRKSLNIQHFTIHEATHRFM